MKEAHYKCFSAFMCHSETSNCELQMFMVRHDYPGLHTTTFQDHFLYHSKVRYKIRRNIRGNIQISQFKIV